jgi:type II secretory ATPase GspE/PulE/Tfp pilus assembly ATPase PilB-like protein
MAKIKGVRGEINIPEEIIKEGLSDIKNVSDIQAKIKSCLGKNTSSLLEFIFIGALLIDASDIHLEAEEDGLKVRNRIDGVLKDITKIESSIAKKIVSRIKLLSSVKLNIKDIPQDGSFAVVFPFEEGPLEIDIRMSTLPSEYGETIVLRLLDPRKLIALEELGLREDLLDLFKKEIKRPNGMILVTGPTGSGKTTTLYAFLKAINHPESKIITIEEPIEYHLDGISQTETKKGGYDFATGLKAIMRQDPDVILVGEIRDLETTQIAIQAALTGHLVFSTLHTNDAPGTISRLISLGEKTSNIAPAVNVIIAQRLVRKICPLCSVIETPDEKIVAEIKEELSSVDKNIFSFPSNVEIPRAVGCRGCNFTGYKGRMGVHEAFVVDDETENFLFSCDSTAELRQKAVEKGMITVRQDALIKLIQQKTTMDEVNRVTQI